MTAVGEIHDLMPRVAAVHCRKHRTPNELTVGAVGGIVSDFIDSLRRQLVPWIQSNTRSGGRPYLGTPLSKGRELDQQVASAQAPTASLDLATGGSDDERVAH